VKLRAGGPEDRQGHHRRPDSSCGPQRVVIRFFLSVHEPNLVALQAPSTLPIKPICKKISRLGRDHLFNIAQSEEVAARRGGFLTGC
jgi:hypothetical protein